MGVIIFKDFHKFESPHIAFISGVTETLKRSSFTGTGMYFGACVLGQTFMKCVGNSKVSAGNHKPATIIWSATIYSF